MNKSSSSSVSFGFDNSDLRPPKIIYIVFEYHVIKLIFIFGQGKYAYVEKKNLDNQQ
jgi:hypothetical protein